MYLEHFGLREFPFGLTPNTQFFCALPAHQEALNVLLVALNGDEGFIKITGECGVGKTMICRKLLNLLDSCATVAYIPNPALSQAELLSTVAEELGIPFDDVSRPGHVLKLINDRLIEVAATGRRLVLILDEAQAIPQESLELLRLLTNLETESRKLLQIILFGQPELDALLDRPEMRQLRQRISFSFSLRVLKREETQAYLFNRLRVAGYAQRDLFTRPAYWLIHQYSRGIPRLLNIIAHKAMMTAYGKGERRVRASHVQAAALDTEGVAGSGLKYWLIGLIVLGAVTVWAFNHWSLMSP